MAVARLRQNTIDPIADQKTANASEVGRGAQPEGEVGGGESASVSGRKEYPEELKGPIVDLEKKLWYKTIGLTG